MYLKIFGIILILTSSTLYGFKLSNIYEYKIKILKMFLKFISTLKGEIEYSSEEIKEILIDIKDNQEKEIKKFIGIVWKQLENNNTLKEAWNYACNNYLLKECFFNKSSIKYILDVGNNLGTTNKKSQVDFLNKEIEYINNQIKEMDKLKKEKCKIYKTLGIITGMFVGIILM